MAAALGTGDLMRAKQLAGELVKLGAEADVQRASMERAKQIVGR